MPTPAPAPSLCPPVLRSLRGLLAALAPLAPLVIAMAASALPFWFHTLGH